MAGHPYPECGAMSFAIALDTDAATAAFGNGLADVQPKAGALNELVELDETVEDGGLLLLGDACACVLTVDVETSRLVVWGVGRLVVWGLRKVATGSPM